MSGSLKRIGAGVIVAGLIGAFGAVSTAAGRFTFGVNETESLSHWAFVTDHRRRTPKAGDLVDFVAPPNPYYPRGARFVKVVYGVEGQLVERRGLEVFVAGRRVGRAKTHARDGRATRLGPTGPIPPGRYFVGTPHPDGYDSRYAEIGFISRTDIVGVARPIL